LRVPRGLSGSLPCTMFLALCFVPALHSRAILGGQPLEDANLPQKNMYACYVCYVAIQSQETQTPPLVNGQRRHDRTKLAEDEDSTCLSNDKCILSSLIHFHTYRSRLRPRVDKSLGSEYQRQQSNNVIAGTFSASCRCCSELLLST
jgi:hypothetical protein